MITEICTSDTESRLHRDYYNLIASEDLCKIIKKSTPNQIIHCHANTIKKKLGIRTVSHLINEYKFPSTDKYRDIIELIIRNGGSLINILSNRKMLNGGYSYRDGIAIDSNQLMKIELLTTKKIRLRLLNKNRVKTKCHDFMQLKKIIHPKERELLYFQLHQVILTNEKLFNMNLKLNPYCQVCHEVQTSNHIFKECPNALGASEVLWQR